MRRFDAPRPTAAVICHPAPTPADAGATDTAMRTVRHATAVRMPIPFVPGTTAEGRYRPLT